MKNTRLAYAVALSLFNAAWAVDSLYGAFEDEHELNNNPEFIEEVVNVLMYQLNTPVDKIERLREFLDGII